MLFRPNPSSGVPIYLQLIEQVRHAVETGVLRAGEQLPGIRKAAEDLVINPNTVAKAYRELEHLGVVELRQGMGAFIKAPPHNGAKAKSAERIREAAALMEDVVRKLAAMRLSEEAMRRLFESAVTRRNSQ